MTTHKKIAIYGRVSTSHQEEQKTIQTQLMAINEFANAKGFTIVQQYLDEGWSGDSIIRPALDQLRVDAKKKLWDAVLIYDPDRLARRYSYQELITDELKEARIEVLFVTTPTPKDGVEKIIYGVQGLFAEYERAKITERFRLGKVRLAKEGHVMVSRSAFGYTFIQKKGKKGEADFRQGHYVINDIEAEVIKNIFSWIGNEGYSLRKVAKRLQSLNIKPRYSSRGLWNSSTIGRIVKNRTYIGEAHFGASRAVMPKNPKIIQGYKRRKKTSQIPKPESEWIKIKVPAIVDVDLFERTQKRIKINFQESARNTKNIYLLTGKIYCSCGTRSCGAGRMKNFYYRCNSRQHSFPLPSPCREKAIRADVADSIVWFKVKEALTDSDLFMEYIGLALDKYKSETENNAVYNIEKSHSEIERLSAQKDRYVKAYSIGAVSIDELDSYIKAIKSKIDTLQNEVVMANEAKEQNVIIVIPGKSEVEAYADKARKAIKLLNNEEINGIIKSLVEKVVANKSSLDIYGYLPEINVELCPHTDNDVDAIKPFLVNSNSNKIPFKIHVDVKDSGRIHGLIKII